MKIIANWMDKKVQTNKLLIVFLSSGKLFAYSFDGHWHIMTGFLNEFPSVYSGVLFQGLEVINSRWLPLLNEWIAGVNTLFYFIFMERNGYIFLE